MNDDLLEIIDKKFLYFFRAFICLYVVFVFGTLFLAATVDHIIIPNWFSLIGPLLFVFGITWLFNDLKLKNILKNHHLGSMLISRKSIHISLFIDFQYFEQHYSIPKACCLCLRTDDFHKKPYVVNFSNTVGNIRKSISMKFIICKNCLKLNDAAKPLSLGFSLMLIILSPIITVLLFEGPEITSGGLALLSLAIGLLPVIFMGISITGIFPYVPPVKIIGENKIAFASKKYAEAIAAINPGWRIEDKSIH